MAKGQRGVKFKLNGKSIDDCTQEELKAFMDADPQNEGIVIMKYEFNYKAAKALYDVNPLMLPEEVGIDTIEELAKAA